VLIEKSSPAAGGTDFWNMMHSLWPFMHGILPEISDWYYVAAFVYSSDI
jgi:hypothetical protein